MMKEKLLKYVHSLASQMPILLVLLDLHFEGVEGVNKAEGNKHLTLGNQLLHAGQLADALTQYHSSIDNDPNNYQAYYMRATVYLAMGRSRTALPDLDQVISLQPNFVKARLQRGNLYLKMGRFNDAQIDYEAVLSQEDNADAKAKVEVIRPLRRNINQAAQSFQSKDYRQVVNYMKEVIETCPWNAEFRETRAMAHEGLGDLRSAISDLKPTTTLRLDNTAGYLKISILYYRLGDIEQSLDEIRECLKLDPDHKECYAHYKNVKKLFKTVESGRKFMNEERWDDAIGKFTKALQQEPRIPAFNLEIKLRICESYVKKASPIEALAACKDVLKYDSHNIPAIFLISEAYTLNSQYQEAVDILQEASQIDENYPGLNDKIKQAQKLLKQSQKRDYYKILGVSRNARKREIEKAYRNLARQWHPDNFKTEEEKKSAESKFIDLAAAKEVLTDPDKLRIYLAGYDPLDRDDVEQWERGESPGDINNVFKFFFHSGGKKADKKPFEDILKAFGKKTRKDVETEDDDEDEEFLQESRRRKEEKLRREEQEQFKKQEEMRKKSEMERQRKMEEERKRKEEEQKKYEEEMRRKRAMEEEKRRQMIEMQKRKLEEQRKRYYEEQQRKLQEERKRKEEQQRRYEEELRRRRELEEERRRNINIQLQKQQEQKRQYFEEQQRKFQERMGNYAGGRQDSDAQGIHSQTAGKSKKTNKKKSKKKTKKSKSKKAKKSKKDKSKHYTKGTDGRWYEKNAYGRWIVSKGPDDTDHDTSVEDETNGKKPETYRDSEGNVFVKANDGNWYMRVESPSVPQKPDADSSDDDEQDGGNTEPKVKILAGGVYKDNLGRILDAQGNIYLPKGDGTLRMIGNVKHLEINKNVLKDKKEAPRLNPWARQSSFVHAEADKSYFHDKNGIPYVVDKNGNYVRVKGPEELKQEANSRKHYEDLKSQYSYREQSTAQARDRWTQPQYGQNEQWNTADQARRFQTNTGQASSQDIRAEIMRQQEMIAKRLMDAQLGQTQDEFYNDRNNKRTRYTNIHEEL